MANITSKKNALLQEWAPLTILLEKIPTTIHLGLFTQDLNFTCIDIIPEFIAVGTNHGTVYWFNRKTEDIETLRCQNTNSSITCIRIVSTVDYMIAAGNSVGIVTIFQIPKQHPDSLPQTWKSTKRKQVERFNISGFHKVSITAVEWSKNGMKLFSGDKNGLVVLTEMDFYMHLSKSTEFLNEKYCVVQLSYQNGLLLISTLFRSIIVEGIYCNKIKQIGQKERKTLGKFGAVFFKNKNNIKEPIIYASRPGLRIWQADKNGIVLKTLILKEAIKLDQAQVKLLNPVSEKLKKKIQDFTNFGIIVPFSDDLLVTYNHDVIYFINPNTNTIISIITNLRKITDIACFEDEIFILEGERNILRIAYNPEIITSNSGKVQPTNHIKLIAERNNHTTLGFTNLKTKLKLSAITPGFFYDTIKLANIIQAIRILPSIVIGVDTTSIIHADEAVEVEPNIPINLDSHLVTEIDLIYNKTKNRIENKRLLSDRKDIFRKIGEQEFEEIVFNPQRKYNEVINETFTIAQKSQINMTIIENNQISFRENKTNNLITKSNNSFQQIQNLDLDINLGSKNNLERIKESIEDKERLLFDYLNLDLSMYVNKSKICSGKSNSCTTINFSEYTNDFIYSCNTDKKCESQVLESAKQKDKNYKTNLITFEEVNYYKYSKKHISTKQTSHKSDIKNRKVSEIQFNALSKEFVKSVMYQESDDWILLG